MLKELGIERYVALEIDPDSVKVAVHLCIFEGREDEPLSRNNKIAGMHR